MKVLVTGANGLLASNIVFELIQRKVAVRGMVRKTSNLFSLKDIEFEKFYGDITDIHDIERAVKGCDIIIHAAADTSQYHRSLEDYLPVNVHATENIMQVAVKNNVKRVVYVSSANTFGHGSIENPGTENLPPRFPFTRSYYAISKQLAQHAVLKYAGHSRTEVIVVNPAFMIGPRDAKPSSGKLVLLGYKRKIIPVPPGGKNFVHVANVAMAVCNAIDKGKNGECYLLAGENMSYYEFFKIIEQVTGKKKIFVKIPSQAFIVTGYIGSFFAKMGFNNPFNKINTKIMCIKNFYSARKALAELDMPHTPVSMAVKDCLKWFKKNGYVN